jgi:hypothetical protein
MLNTAYSSYLHCIGCSHPQALPRQADLIPSPDDDLKLMDLHGYVAIDIQLLVSLLDGEDHKDFLRL